MSLSSKRLFLALATALCAVGQTYTISTYAGGGPLPGSGPALRVSVGAVETIAVDASGNLYMALSRFGMVMKVDSASGAVTPFAGTGVFGYSGDGGPATSAQLGGCDGIATDSAGAVYIADVSSSVVRKVSGGVITTVAGTGKAGYSGDNGPALSAQLFEPRGIAVDANFNLYIADSQNGRIRKVSNGIITTIAGNRWESPTTSICTPVGLALDAAGNLYVADALANVIRKVSGGTVTTVAGTEPYICGIQDEGALGDGGPATSAYLASPLGISVDSSGNLYIADHGNQRVRMVANGIISTFAGNGTSGYGGDGGPAARAQLNSPSAVATDARGNVYIADTWNMRVRKVSGGIIETAAGNGLERYGGDGGPASEALLNSPVGLAIDSAGNLYFSDCGNNVVRMVSQGVITTVAGNGIAGYSGDGAPATNAELNGPRGIALDSAGTLYIADIGNSAIRKVSGGIITTVASLSNPFALALDASGTLYAGTSDDGDLYSLVCLKFAICETTPAQIDEFQNGYLRTLPMSGPAPAGIGGMALAPTGALFFSQASGYLGLTPNPSRAISNVSELANGVVTPVAGTGTWGSSGDGGLATAAQLSEPAGLAFDTLGSLWIAEAGNSRIRRVVQGVISTVAGNGMMGNSGDGGPATSAELSFPYSVAIDASGRVFIADTYNNRIRVLTPPAAFVNPLISGVSAVFPSSVQPAPAAFAPGEIVSIYGTTLCTGQQAAGVPLSSALAGCAVWFDNPQIPLYYGSAGQINAVLPQNATVGAHSLHVGRYTDSSRSQLAAQSVNLAIQIAAVSMDFVETTDSGNPVLAVQYQDGGFAGAARPVAPGDIVTLYLTGLGATNPAFPDGTAPGTTATAIHQPQIMVEGVPAQILYAGVQPQYPGLDQIVLVVPRYSLPSGKATAAFAIGVPSVSQAVTYQVPAK